MLRRVAESLEDRIVHRREIVEMVLLLSGCFVMLSVIFFTVACCSSYSSSSFWISCGAGGVDKGEINGGEVCEGGVDG